MLRHSFLWRLYAVNVGLIMLTLAFVGVIVADRTEHSALERIRESLRSEAIYLHDITVEALAAPEPSPEEIGRFKPRIDALGADTGTRLTVIRDDGLVIADSAGDESTFDNHSERPEVVEARAEGIGTATRYSDSIGRVMMYVALPIVEEGRVLGFARASLPLTELDRRIAQIRRLVAAAVVVATVLALLVGFYIHARAVRPLTEITRAAQAIAIGEQLDIDTHRRDEIGRLATAVQAMGEKLKDRLGTIEDDRNKLHAVLSSMGEGVVAIDGGERVVHINGLAADILNMSEADSVGRPLREVGHIREILDALTTALRTGSKVMGEVRLVIPNGERVLNFHASPLRSANGAAGGGSGAVVVLRDITELRRLETMRRDFVANVSHELKTPLTAIRGLVETVTEDPEMDPSVRDRFIGRIRNQAQRLSALVSDLLTVSRLESEANPIEREICDLAAIGRESLASALADATEKGLELRAALPGDVVPVRGDREAVVQLVDNLVVNAIQYTPEGGTIEVRVRAQGGQAIVEVEDTGIGIDLHHQDRIFERFYRVDKARSRELGGTGLGLSIVKHTALAHDGGVSVRSTLGKGTTFLVWFPLAAASGSSSHSQADPATI